MKRSKHSLSHYKLVTGDMGKLIPVGLMEALPGDTFQQSTSLLLRMSPLQAPVMHPVNVRLHHWFVPNRLVYEGWEDFITGGKDGLGSSVPYPVNDGVYNVATGDLLDYLGVPLASHLDGTLNLMPILGYNSIFNEWYRDEDLVDEITGNTRDVQNIAWEKDYFTSSRPWAQKGPTVTLPIGDKAPIVGIGQTLQSYSPGPEIYETGATGTRPYDQSKILQDDWHGEEDPDNPGFPGIFADLSNAEPPDIRAVRQAFALQRYQEARAQYGSRYTEYLRYLGIKSSDARLQRPEYLGGGRQTVAFSEVLRTGNDPGGAPGDGPIGEMFGHGIAAMRSNRYRYFCEEHGYIFSMLSVRPRTMYMDGLDRTWSRRTKEDYYQKELELIGQQEVFNREVFVAADTADDQIFGYQDRYSEYRHEYSKVAGEFQTILDYWHLGRKFSDTPVLNQAFTDCDPSKRIFSEQDNHSMWIMVSHNIQARRLVGKRTIGRII